MIDQYLRKLDISKKDTNVSLIWKQLFIEYSEVSY